MTRKLAILASCGTLAALSALSAPAQAAVPAFLTQQGRLVSSGVPVNTAVTITFRIYAQPTGGTALWTDPQVITPTTGTSRHGSAKPRPSVRPCSMAERSTSE
jgi:hypothetical protein